MSIFWGRGYPWGGGVWGGFFEIFLRKLDPGYVVGKYELARCVGSKVGGGQTLSYCEKRQFLGEIPMERGRLERVV